jgi:hypothetical protein
LKEECKFELKAKSLARNITLSTPYKDLTIVEDELDNEYLTTPKRADPTPLKLFNSNEETATRPTTYAPTFTRSIATPSVAVALDDNVVRPLEKLKNRRKSSHISDPLSTSCNHSIKFSYFSRYESINKSNIRVQVNEERIKK